MKSEDYYQLLGVSRYASTDAIKRAFRCRVRSVHPDQNPHDSLAAKRTRDVIQAYRVLSDPLRKKLYDSAIDRPCEPAPADYHPPAQAARLHPRYCGRMWAVMLGIALAGYFAAMLWHGLSNGGVPVYRAELIQTNCLTPQVSVPYIAEPSASDCLQWYVAREYHISFAGPWATRGMAELCADSAQHASQRGDKDSEDFYRAVQCQVLRGPSAIML